MAPENAISVNKVTGKRNKDGSMTIRFGGDPKTVNYLRIMPGWNYVVRLYRPRRGILDGTWSFRSTQAARSGRERHPSSGRVSGGGV